MSIATIAEIPKSNQTNQDFYIKSEISIVYPIVSLRIYWDESADYLKNIFACIGPGPLVAVDNRIVMYRITL